MYTVQPDKHKVCYPSFTCCYLAPVIPPTRVQCTYFATVTTFRSFCLFLSEYLLRVVFVLFSMLCKVAIVQKLTWQRRPKKTSASFLVVFSILTFNLCACHWNLPAVPNKILLISVLHLSLRFSWRLFLKCVLKTPQSSCSFLGSWLILVLK